MTAFWSMTDGGQTIENLLWCCPETMKEGAKQQWGHVSAVEF